MVKVSGVPYDVNLPFNDCESEIISELERENQMMRARMERLEQEARTANELADRLSIELMNLQRTKDDLK